MVRNIWLRKTILNQSLIYTIFSPEICSMSLQERITIDPNICHGKPTIRGLRYPVETILELMASGMTNEDILSDYPDLEIEDIYAVIQFAADIVKVKNISKLVA